MRRHLDLLREFSIPLVAGVCVALLWANLHPDRYRAFIDAPVIGNVSLLFVTNDLFMTLFFGIAALEITQSCLPGGDLHPLSLVGSKTLGVFSFSALAGRLGFPLAKGMGMRGLLAAGMVAMLSISSSRRPCWRAGLKAGRHGDTLEKLKIRIDTDEQL